MDRGASRSTLRDTVALPHSLTFRKSQLVPMRSTTDRSIHIQAQYVTVTFRTIIERVHPDMRTTLNLCLRCTVDVTSHPTFQFPN